MLTTFPSAWLVLALPFASAAVIASVRPLRALSANHHRMTWSIGILGLCLFSVGLVGMVPAAATIPAVILGGAVSGFACFWSTSGEDDGGDWRRWHPLPDDRGGPPGAPASPIDWQNFDRLRAQWERRPQVMR